MNFFSNPLWVGSLAGIFTSISLLPQLFKMIREKKSQDISITMLVVLFCGLGLWVYYGMLKKDLPVVVTNSFSLLTNASIIFFSIKYRAAGKKRFPEDSSYNNPS